MGLPSVCPKTHSGLGSVGRAAALSLRSCAEGIAMELCMAKKLNFFCSPALFFVAQPCLSLSWERRVLSARLRQRAWHALPFGCIMQLSRKWWGIQNSLQGRKLPRTTAGTGSTCRMYKLTPETQKTTNKNTSTQTYNKPPWQFRSLLRMSKTWNQKTYTPEEAVSMAVLGVRTDEPPCRLAMEKKNISPQASSPGLICSCWRLSSSTLRWPISHEPLFWGWVSHPSRDTSHIPLTSSDQISGVSWLGLGEMGPSPNPTWIQASTTGAVSLQY